MEKNTNTSGLSRRKFIGTAAASAAGLALSTKSLLGFPAILQGVGKPNSKFNGVQIGTITYSFRSMPNSDAESTLKYIVDSGISAVELMGPVAESFAGIPESDIPRGGGRGRGAEQVELTPAQQREQEEMQVAREAFAKEVAAWRANVSMDKFEQFRKMYKDAGVSIYAWKPSVFGASNTDAEIEYGLRVAKALGASHCTVELPPDPAQSLRLGQLAAKHKVAIAYHTHLQGNMTAFDTAFSQSEYNRSNVDIGHFVAAGGNPIPFLQKFHDKISSIHIKDRKNEANGQQNMPWGEGDTPLVAALQLMRDEKYKFPASAELEYQIPEGSDAVKELAKCVEYTRKALEA